MISLEIAKKLKEAGLKWEPKAGDWFYRKDGVRGFVTDANMGDWWAVFPPDGKEVAFCIEEADRFIFAPRLDQLLAEIDTRGYCFEISNMAISSSKPRETLYSCKVFPKKRAGVDDDDDFVAYDETLINAAASALLWILEGRAVRE